MPALLGVNFGGESFGGPEAPERQGRNICGINLPRNLRAIFPNSPDQNDGLSPNLLCKTSGSRFCLDPGLERRRPCLFKPLVFDARWDVFGIIWNKWLKVSS